MIQFFRRIRQKLLSQNKVSQYFFYAIGEILLVVIGILIALNINNANEKRKNQEKITTILKEIQTDLLTDITESVRLFERFKRSDSIQDIILNNKYTVEDYKYGKTEFIELYYDSHEVQTNGYDNLMRNIDNVSEERRTLLKDLKNLYVVNKSYLDASNKRIQKTVYDNIDSYYRQKWSQQLNLGNFTDEAIDYYRNDFSHKNQVASYINDFRWVFRQSQSFRVNAINAYKVIADIVKNGDSIPEIVSYVANDLTLLNKIAGNYKLKESTGKWADNLKITIVDGLLILNSERFSNAKCYFLKNRMFYIDDMIFDFNKIDSGEFSISGNIEGKAIYTKMD
jgi:uncharacterized membrane protein YgaE (UPF0421/DUF939 family)